MSKNCDEPSNPSVLQKLHASLEGAYGKQAQNKCDHKNESQILYTVYNLYTTLGDNYKIFFDYILSNRHIQLILILIKDSTSSSPRAV